MVADYHISCSLQYEAFCLHMSCEEVKEAAMALTDLYASITYTSTCTSLCCVAFSVVSPGLCIMYWHHLQSMYMCVFV